MRIAFYTDNLYPEVSGISDSILTLGAELKKRGHEVCFVGPRYAPRDYKGVGAEPEATLVRLPSLYFPGSPTGHGRIVIPCGASLRFMRRWQPDIIHTQTPYGAGLEALLVSRALGVPLVGTNHTEIEKFVEYSPLPFPGLMHIARAFDTWYYNRCIFITTPYQGLLDHMHSRGLRARGQRQPNPILVERFVPAADEERARLRRAHNLGGLVLLHCGRLAPEKHVDVMLEAVARLLPRIPDITLVVTGHGSAEAALRAQAARLGIEGAVRFVGFVEQTTLAELYTAADIFVVMSTAETHSLALMQAYATATPAIAARAGALPDYTPSECGFLVPPGDAAALAEKVETLAKDASLCARMGAAGRQYVQQFAPAAVAEAWERIYKDALR